MTADQLVRTLRSFNKRKPFRRYFVEFVSGERVEITHPEAIDPRQDLFIYRAPDHQVCVFASDSICRFLADQ